MVSLSMRYSLFKRLLKSRTHVDLHQTEPVPMPQNGRYLSRIERVESPGRGDRGRMTLSPGQGGPATAGDERLQALISCARGIVVPPACGGRCSMVDFQAIDHCSNTGDRGHGRQEFFYLVRGN